MTGNTFYSVKDLSREENLTVAVWLTRLCENIESYDRNEEVQTLYNALVDALGLREHSNKVIAAVNALHKKNKRLTVKKDAEKINHPYKMRGEIKTVYKEDNCIYDRSGNWESDNEDDINLVRAVFADNKKKIFPQIVCWTFFSPPDSTRKTFTLPEDKKCAIPQEYQELVKKADKVSLMTDSFKLDKDEAELLNIAYLAHTIREVYPVFNNLMNHEKETRFSTYAKCAGKTLKDVKKLLRRDKKLVLYGLFDNEADIEQDAVDCIYSGDLNTFFCDVLKEDEKKEIFELSSFNVKEKKTNLALRLLQNDSAANILLYGAPGAGKTEFARSLVKETGLKPLIFKNEMEVEGAKGEASNRALYRLNCLLSLQKKDSVIIVDEAESLLQTCESFFGYWYLSDPEKKGTINKMIENSGNKVIWILNYTKPLDESTLRRFTYAIEFREMTRTMLRNIADTKLNTVQMNNELHTEIVNLCGKYHVTGASVDNMIKTVKGFDLSKTPQDRVVDDVKEVLESNSTLLFGKKKMRETVRPSYDLSILNTSTSPEQIFKMVQNARNFAEKNKIEPSGDTGIRMLFYGTSGTGKTELARYIAEKLEKKIILKRASDILGPYVGMSEKNIKDAFEEAENSGDILLFDEADSFFADRNSARNSWERTQVNEFLTQMEEFSGILICTTNLRSIMDPAMQRRFHILSEFKPLTEKGVERCMEKYFASYDFDQSDIDRVSAYNTATPGDFGALSGKIRFMDEDDISKEMIIDELCKTQEEKEGTVRRIGFGAA